MALKINVDPDKPSDLRGTLGVAGSVLGGLVGSIVPGVGTLAGAAAGSAAGSALGSLGGGLADSQINKGKDLQGGGVPLSNDSAIQRRMDQQNDNPLNHVTDAINLLHTLPPALRHEYGAPLAQAYQAANPDRFGMPDQGPTEGVS